MLLGSHQLLGSVIVSYRPERGWRAGRHTCTTIESFRKSNQAERS